HVVVTETVAVAAIERSGRIERVVTFEAEQSEQGRLVHRGAQGFERGPEPELRRRWRSLVQPERAIAANIAALDAVLAASDARWADLACGVAASRLGRKCRHCRRGQKFRHERNAIVRDGIAEARQRRAFYCRGHHRALGSTGMSTKRQP